METVLLDCVLWVKVKNSVEVTVEEYENMLAFPDKADDFLIGLALDKIQDGEIDDTEITW